MALDMGEVYPLFLSAVYYFWGSNFPAARIAQAVLGTLSLLLLFAITARFLGKRIAIPALLIAAVYPPFILSEGRLLTETVAIFLLLLTAWLLTLSLARGSLAAIFFSGIAVAVLTVSRTFFQFSALVFFPLLLVGLAVGRKSWWPLRSLLFLLGFALIIVPRLLFTPQVDKDHRRLISGSWRNGLAMYCGVYPPNQGYQTDSDPGGPVLARVRKSARPRSSPDDDYLKATAEILLSQPWEAAPVILGKAGIFWTRAYNDFLQSYLLFPEGIDALNRAILALGLWGLAALLGIGPVAWPFLACCLYTWALCFIADAEARYTLPAIPFMITAAVYFLYRLGRGAFSLWKMRRHGRYLFSFFLAAGGLLFLLSRLTLPPRFLSLFPGMDFIFAHRLHALFVSLFLLSPFPVLIILYRDVLSGWRRWMAVLLPSLAAIAFYLSTLSIHPFWRQWTVRLARSGQKITQRIVLPPEQTLWKGAELKLDLVSGPGRDYDLLVKVDGELVRRFERGLSADPDSFIAQRRAFPIYLKEQGRRLTEVRQWFSVPLDPAKIAGKKEIAVELELEPLGASRGSWVELYGDFDDPGAAEIPTFSQSPAELSLYRYLVEDDWRLWRRLAVLPGESLYTEDGKSRGKDLSPAPGLQTGR
ncbi:MAG: glycosyltransferase family 39 protein, partial [Candidatus Aureabacteria bacterium]|nr:glycosyltransferase family 39 protein [Candidatus Auribacterota bacterium]